MNSMILCYSVNFIFYWQASCILECQMSNAMSNMSNNEKCTPWYLPPLDSNFTLCSPFDAKNFSNAMEKMSNDLCKVCICENKLPTTLPLS